MTQLHDHIRARAADLVAAGVRNRPVARLAAFLEVGEGDCIAALSSAPDHIREAFGLSKPAHDRKAIAGLFERGRKPTTSPWRISR